MLIDTRPTAMPALTFRPAPEVIDTSAVIHTAASVRELVDAAALLVANLDLRDAALWAEASSAVAATAATLRSAVINLTGQAGSLHATGPIDAVPVAATAAPVVRAREIGFLTSRLAAALRVSEQDRIHATLTAVGYRLEEDLRMLRGALDVDAAAPRGHRTARFRGRRR